MALNVILIALTVVSILNALLVYDLYGRSAKLIIHVNSARRAIDRIIHLTTEDN